MDNEQYALLYENTGDFVYLGCQVLLFDTVPEAKEYIQLWNDAAGSGGRTTRLFVVAVDENNSVTEFMD